MGRVEEILEIGEAAEGFATVLERSGADQLPDPRALRELVRSELDLAAVDIASWRSAAPAITDRNVAVPVWTMESKYSSFRRRRRPERPDRRRARARSRRRGRRRGLAR